MFNERRALQDILAAPPVAMGDGEGYFSLKSSAKNTPKPEALPPLPESIPDLRVLFQNREADPILRIRAARALMDQGAPETPESLKAMLESIPDFFKAKHGNLLLAAVKASLPFSGQTVKRESLAFEEVLGLGNALWNMNINPPSEEGKK